MMAWLEDPGVDEFHGLKLADLKLDEAYVNVTSTAFNSTAIYQLLGECRKCPFSRLISLRNSTSDLNETFTDEEYLQHRLLAVNTADHLTWRIYANQDNHTISQYDKDDMICELKPSMGEFGVYELHINDTDCSFETLKDPVDIYKPLWLLLGGLCALWLVSAAIRALFAVIRRRGRMDTLKAAAVSRIASLDIFRGLCVITMILVNDGLGGYRFGSHSLWDGLTLADVVFPAFLWIMGVGIPLHTQAQLIRDTPRITMIFQILRRSCMLFIIGLALTTAFGTDFTNMRIFGVLQRFAITYLIVASMFAIFTRKYRPQPTGRLSSLFWDVTGIGPQWIVTIMLLGIHTATIYLLPIPGCPRGYVGPGGMHQDWAYTLCTGGATRYLDALFLGESHLYRNAEVRQAYSTPLHVDPEGVLSTLPSIVTVMLGAQVGASVLAARVGSGASGGCGARLRMLGQALVVGAIGVALCGASLREDGVIPLNKHLWSLSFALVTGALSAALLAILSVLSDDTGAKWEQLVPRWSGAPFLAAGRNSLLLYVGHELLYAAFPWHWRFGTMNTHFIRLLECFTGAVVWLVIASVMHRKRLYITV